jgi:hypothetical protein
MSAEPIREGDDVGENEFAPSNHPIHVELIGAYMAAVPASRLRPRSPC